jgi:AcrR family transcriptional regulator
MPRNPSAKSDETRQKILSTALDLFRRDGFDQTTMRGIAAAAGVATGLAYYYYASKEALVMAFYERAQVELQPLLEEAQAAHRKLEPRLRAFIQTKLEYFTPNRKFLGALMGTAANPNHPLSPFSEQNRVIREADFAAFDRALAETKTTVATDLAPHIGKMLWMYQMGVILFWLYDESPGQTRTQRLLDRSVSTVCLLIRLASFPLLKPARKLAIELIEIVES